MLTDQEVGEAMNKAFVNLKFDAEKGDGISLAKKYEVSSYPTLIIIDSEGNLLQNIGGNLAPQKNTMLEVAAKYHAERKSALGR